jgi:hypothetical protein
MGGAGGRGRKQNFKSVNSEMAEQFINIARTRYLR